MSLYFLLFFQGLITFISPCLLPMLPVYIIYLSAGEAGNYKRLVINTLGFIAGFSLIFILLGASASSLGSTLIKNRLLFTRVMGVVVIFIGIYYLFGETKAFLKLKSKFKQFLVALKLRRDTAAEQVGTGQINLEKKPLHFFSSFLFGVSFSASWSACISPTLGTAIAYASVSNSLSKGILLLFVFSLGLSIPFFIFAIFAYKLRNVSDFFKQYGAAFQKFSAILIIIMGIVMANGNVISYLNQIQRWFSF